MVFTTHIFPKWLFSVVIVLALNNVVASVYASEIDEFTGELSVTPIVLDVSGSRLNEYSAGTQLVLRTITQNPSSGAAEYIAIVEIRKIPDNISYFVSLQSASIVTNGEHSLDVSWVADESGNYQMRTFAISNLTKPQILSTVSITEFSIYDDSFKGLIRMTRGPCDGGCPYYVVEVYQNGTAIFDGRDGVTDPGKHIFEISTTQIDELVSEINKADFFALEDTYGSISDGAPWTEVSVNIDGITKTVIDDASHEVPNELLELQNKIDEILNTQRWLEPK